MDSAVRLRSIDCLAMIEQRLPALSGASRRVGDAIMRDPWAILGMTIYDVAAMSGVSLPSVTRFCRAVGYPGFRDLVQGIAQSLGRIETLDSFEGQKVAEGESELSAITGAVVRRHTEALTATLRNVDYDKMQRAIEAIAGARQIFICGTGSLKFAAEAFAFKLAWSGLRAFGCTPSGCFGRLVTINPEDVVIGITYQGRTREVIDVLEISKRLGATTIAVTTLPDGPIDQHADISLLFSTNAINRRGDFFTLLDTVMVLSNVIASVASERRWPDGPPNQAQVNEWFERNGRVPPLPYSPAADNGADDAVEVMPRVETMRG